MACLQYIKCILSVCIWCFALCLSLFYFLELETYFEVFGIKYKTYFLHWVFIGCFKPGSIIIIISPFSGGYVILISTPRLSALLLYSGTVSPLCIYFFVSCFTCTSDDVVPPLLLELNIVSSNSATSTVERWLCVTFSILTGFTRIWICQLFVFVNNILNEYQIVSQICLLLPQTFFTSDMLTCH